MNYLMRAKKFLRLVRNSETRDNDTEMAENWRELNNLTGSLSFCKRERILKKNINAARPMKQWGNG